MHQDLDSDLFEWHLQSMKPYLPADIRDFVDSPAFRVISKSPLRAWMHEAILDYQKDGGSQCFSHYGDRKLIQGSYPNGYDYYAYYAQYKTLNFTQELISKLTHCNKGERYAPYGGANIKSSVKSVNEGKINYYENIRQYEKRFKALFDSEELYTSLKKFGLDFQRQADFKILFSGLLDDPKRAQEYLNNDMLVEYINRDPRKKYEARMDALVRRVDNLLVSDEYKAFRYVVQEIEKTHNQEMKADFLETCPPDSDPQTIRKFCVVAKKFPGLLDDCLKGKERFTVFNDPHVMVGKLLGGDRKLGWLDSIKYKRNLSPDVPVGHVL